MPEIQEHGDERMKAVIMDSYGTPDVLELRDVAKPTPKAEQVLVRVLAASVNDWDWALLRGAPVNRLLSGLFRPRVHILGCDIAGRVEAVGGGVTAFRPGDEVYGDLSSSGFGAFAEYVSVPRRIMYPLPANMSFEQAALIEAVSVAVHGVGLTPIRLGDTGVVVGSGMIGLLAIQAVRHAGCSRVLAVDTDAARLNLARAAGA